jgi:hypothetical protein
VNQIPRNIRVALDWDGPYSDLTQVTGRAGIYMVIAGRTGGDGKWNPSTYALLDIGQSGETADRLASHDREECWKLKKPAGTTLLFKFAAMPSDQYDETERRIVECCLRAHHRPLPCGTECNEGYTRDDSVVITNTGQYSPLKQQYSC